MNVLAVYNYNHACSRRNEIASLCPVIVQLDSCPIFAHEAGYRPFTKTPISDPYKLMEQHCHDMLYLKQARWDEVSVFRAVMTILKRGARSQAKSDLARLMVKAGITTQQKPRIGHSEVLIPHG